MSAELGESFFLGDVIDIRMLWVLLAFDYIL